MQAIGNTIIFTFVDQVRNGKFIDFAQHGLYLGFNSERSANLGRYAIVKCVGPEVKEIKEGDKIVIEALRWSSEFKFEGKSYWKTTEDQVMAIEKG